MTGAGDVPAGAAAVPDRRRAPGTPATRPADGGQRRRRYAGAA